MSSSREVKSEVLHNGNLSLMAQRYLRHLGVSAEAPSFEYLCALQKKHIETIPHENIDGIYNIHTAFDIPHLLHKYIVENRGGLCFELNWSFAWLLKQLGFNVEIILADVKAYDLNKENSEYPTHPIIIVHLGESQFLSDVGWSDSYKNPLALTSKEYTDQTGKYRVSPLGDKLVMQKWLYDKDPENAAWHDQFIFLKPKGFQKKLVFPPNFLAAHAYTHIGKGYLFTTLFHFTKINASGHRTIWDNKLLTSEESKKSHSDLKQDVSVILEKDFKVAPNILKKCVKFQRSLSMHNLYKPFKEEDYKESSECILKARCFPF